MVGFNGAGYLWPNQGPNMAYSWPTEFFGLNDFDHWSHGPLMSSAGWEPRIPAADAVNPAPIF